MKKLREALGLTQDELADYLGTSRPFVSQIEAGRRQVPVKVEIQLKPLFEAWYAQHREQDNPESEKPGVPKAAWRSYG